MEHTEMRSMRQMRVIHTVSTDSDISVTPEWIAMILL